MGHVGEGLDVVDERGVRVVSPGADRHRGRLPSRARGELAKSPCSCGGNRRGRGGLPSMTSSMAFSSPKRYSSGPAMMLTVQSGQMPACWNSCTARVTRSSSAV